MPTNTNAMQYNMNKHLYVLDVSYAKSELGLDFIAKEGSLTRAIDKLYRNSKEVYEFIYKHTHYQKRMEYVLAFDEDLRPIIQECLEEQARYIYEMDADYLSYQSGMNLQNGMVIPYEKFRGSIRVSPLVEDILRNRQLLFTGQRFNTPQNFDYETMGY